MYSGYLSFLPLGPFDSNDNVAANSDSTEPFLLYNLKAKIIIVNVYLLF